METPRLDDDDARHPLVVIIDDESQESFAELVRDQGVNAVAVEPDDLDPDLLGRATTVLVDQYLNVWPGRDRLNLPPTLHVPDGVSLASVLRSTAEGGGSGRVPVAFALRTGEMDRLGAGLPRAAREYLMARQFNLEWVFSKEEEASPSRPTPARRVASLARATGGLPVRWGAGSEDPGMRWLCVPESSWTEDVRWQIEQCRPPQHVVAERTAGLAWLRWFLHRILPFPTFLLDQTHLAVSLGLSIESLEDVLRSEGPLATRLTDLKYCGPLSDFLGDRWWRAGVSHLEEELLELAPKDGLARPQAVAAGATNLHGLPLDAVDVTDPVIGVNADYTVVQSPLSAASAVRLQPDDWPPYADDPWAAREELTGEDVDPELLALVVSTDRWHIPELSEAGHDSSEPELGDGSRRGGPLSGGVDGSSLP